MLAQACMDPASTHSPPLHSVMVLDQFLYFSYTVIVCCSNLYLYRLEF